MPGRSLRIARIALDELRYALAFGYLAGLELINGAPQGPWLALIGFFVVMAASAQATSARVPAARIGRVVVVAPGTPLGLISITDVQRALRASTLAQSAASRHAAAG